MNMCVCGYVFCSEHRMPEKHACIEDHAARGKAQIAKRNQRVVNDKVENRL